MNNYGEWRSATIPTNVISVLKMLFVTGSFPGVTVSWQTAATGLAGKKYWLERSEEIGTSPAFELIVTNIPGGVTGTKTFADTSATNGGPYFYRVGVQ